MTRIVDWLGGLMFLAALIEFGANPKAAMKSIPDTLGTSVGIASNGHLVLSGAAKNSKTIQKRISK